MKKGLNPNLKIFDHKEYVILYNSVTHKSYKMGDTEFLVLNQYASSEHAGEFENIFNHPNVQGLISNAEKEEILVALNHIDNPPKSIVRSVPLISFSGSNHFKSNQCVDSFLLLSVATGIMSLIATFVFLPHYHMLLLSVTQSELTDSLAYFMTAIVSLLLSSLIHESSHTIVALNTGADVPEIGIKCFFLFFWAYAKILNISGLSAVDRIRIYIAGCASNLLCGSLSLLGCVFTLFPDVIIRFLFVLGATNLMQFVVNLLFVFKLDGYRILCCVLGTEDIYNDIKGVCSKKPKQTATEMLDLAVYFVFLLINIFFAIFIVFAFIQNMLPCIVRALLGESI